MPTVTDLADALVRYGDGTIAPSDETYQVPEHLIDDRERPDQYGDLVTERRPFQKLQLEGVSEQRMLVAAIQRFGDAERIDDMLDLNRVTIVSASGVWDVPRLLRATKRSKEKRPVTTVFLDGDVSGSKERDRWRIAHKWPAREHNCRSQAPNH